MRDLSAIDAVRDAATGGAPLAAWFEAAGRDALSDDVLAVGVAAGGRSAVIECPRGRVGDEWLRRALSDPSVEKTVFDAKRVGRYLERSGVRLAQSFDPMLAAQLVAGGTLGPVSLGDMAARVLGGEASEPVEGVRAAVTRAEQLERLRGPLEEAIAGHGLGRVAALEFALAPALGRVETAGIRLDAERWQGLLSELEARRARLRREIGELLGLRTSGQSSLFDRVGPPPEINLDSPAQVRKALAAVGIDVPGTRRHQLLPLAGAHPVIPLLLEYREASKLATAYGKNFLSAIHPSSGRIHPTYLQIGTVTGRISATAPALQQIPKLRSYRECFRPEPGRLFVVADLSQIELRIAADLARDRALIESFRRGEDLHRATAAAAFGVAPEAVTERQRAFGKGLNFGMLYGMGAPGLARRTGMAVEAAREAFERYYEAHPELGAWRERAVAYARKHGGTRTRSGRWVRIDFDVEDPDRASELERLAINAPVQGTNADIIKLAMVRLDAQLAGTGSSVVNSVHDELVVECPAEFAEEALGAVRDEMAAAGAEFLREVPVSADAAIAEAWVRG